LATYEAGNFEVSEGGLWHFGPEPITLMPRESLLFGATVSPFSGLGGLSAASESAALFVDGTRLRVQANQPLSHHRLLLGMADGQTLEAELELVPDSIREIELPAGVDAVVLRDMTRKADVVTWRTDVAPSKPGPRAISVARKAFQVQDSAEARFVTAFDQSPVKEAALLDGLNSPICVAASRIGQAMVEIGQGRFDEANHHLEDALSHSAEDPLLWWLKSLAARLEGHEERPELLNAHFLAPLEPALRAESFLAQTPSHNRDPNPLVAPLAESPDHWVEVACLLLECRLFEEASRWIDEALRHRDLPMLRYLMAWALLEGPGMKAEAAVSITMASNQGIEPPLPWRPFERIVIRQLAEIFQADIQLQTMLKLVQPV
jgi:hypothetical protein